MGYCPRCKTVTMEILDRDQNVMPPPGLNWLPPAREFLTYKCSECSYTERKQVQPGTVSMLRRSSNRDSGEAFGGGVLVGWIFAFDAFVCVVQLLVLASNPSDDRGMIVFWLIGAVLFAVTAQREFAQRFHKGSGG
jgi:hypothetical protein